MTNIDPATAIALAKEKFPDLSASGLNTTDVDPVDVDQVATAIAYLRNLRPTKTTTRGSYGLKHSAERWGRANRMEPYVTNGALIAAAVALGFVVKRQDGRNNPNADIGVNINDRLQVDQEIADRDE
jgi:hypothetical protein